ncbi:MAG: rRNA pseudouridine synthase [Rikenellaceae bacterium]|nr:rRNA pseudouridine synthase [Rikenellaceae bacterium]
MKEDDPKTSVEEREKAQQPQDVSRRDDSKPQNTDAVSRFGKDKRKRITRVEKAPGRYEGGREGSPSQGTEQRRSFNPNFTPDNKLRSGGSSYNRSDSGYGKPARDDNYNRSGYRDGAPERKPYGSGGYNKDNRQPYKQGGYNTDDRNREGGYGKPRNYGGDTRPREGGYKPKPYGQRDSKPYAGGGQRPAGGRYQGTDRPGGRPSTGGKYPAGSNPKYNRAGGQGYNARRNDPENYPKYPRGKQEAEIRLNRYISMSGICSRREADELIAKGVVTVNGDIVTEMGAKVQPGDVVRYNGNIIRGENKVYIVMNKPKGYVTSLDDPHAEKTVMDILGSAVKERVYPVGRLDKNSLGVLLITNDGDMTKKLTHPSFEKKKIYQVALDKALSPADRDAIAAGIELEDGFIKADNIDYVNDDPREVGIEIHSGRNRVVRRIFEHFGYQVQKLDRVYFAGLTKKNLKRGAWRFLNPREVAALHSGQYE